MNLNDQVRIEEVKEHLRAEGIPYRASVPILSATGSEDQNSSSVKKAKI